MPVLPTRVDPRVTKGQVLAILEAMKMEHEVRVSDGSTVSVAISRRRSPIRRCGPSCSRVPAPRSAPAPT